jgi:hypothetical protein
LADEILVDFLTLMASMTDDFQFKCGMDWGYPNLIKLGSLIPWFAFQSFLLTVLFFKTFLKYLLTRLSLCENINCIPRQSQTIREDGAESYGPLNLSSRISM